MISQLAVLHRDRLKAQIGAGLVQGNRVKGSQHTDIRQNSRIIFVVTVTIRGNIHDQADMEAGPAITEGMRIFRHLAAELFVRTVTPVEDGVKGAGSDAAPAALTQILINERFPVRTVGNGIAAAFLRATTAPAAKGGIDLRLAIVMLDHLSGTTSASHADVLYGAAKASAFMPFEM